MLAVTTGMRQGELLGLRWEDVDLAGGTLQVRRTLSTRTGRGFSFSPPKTAKGRRSTKLPEVAKKRSLKKHRKAQLEERMKLAGLWEDNGLVFATRLGTPMGRQELVTRSFKPLLKKASLPDIRFHDLRHTCATLLLGKGVHAKFVQELLGHATISTTIQNYKTSRTSLPGLLGRWQCRAVKVIESLKGGAVVRALPVDRHPSAAVTVGLESTLYGFHLRNRRLSSSAA